MSRPSRAAFRGEVTARAYLLDPETIGESSARTRVLARWDAGTRLLHWPDGRWLLLLAGPETGRAEHAPGLPLVGTDGLAVPGEAVAAGEVRVPSGDDTEIHSLDDLAAVDVSGWLAPDAVDIVDLTPVERAAAVVVPDRRPGIEEPDLRAIAGVGHPSSRAGRLADGASLQISRGAKVAVAVAGVLVVLAAVIGSYALATSGSDRPRATATTAPTPPPAPTPSVSALVVPLGSTTVTIDPTDPFTTDFGFPQLDTGPPAAASGGWWHLVVAILVGLSFGALARRLVRRQRAPAAARGRAARASGTGGRRARRPTPARGRWRDRVVRLVLGSPAGGVVGRRHQRYLDKLARDFSQRRWDDALAGAIALGGDGTGLLSLKLPPRRSSLSPLDGGGRSLVAPYGLPVHQRLRELYVEAAQRLEQQGDTARAAFVLAVLLRDAAGAVALLERTGDPALAARIAESRELDPSLVVRLWWQAGDRERAVEIARTRGAFAAAVDRLEQVDKDLSHSLRAAWVVSARRAGDAVTAVDAAWPDPVLRRQALPDIQAGLDAGGPAAGHLLVRFLAGPWDTRPFAGVAVDLAEASTPAAVGLRTGFLTALAREPVADSGLDRRLCSAAALTTLRDPDALASVPGRDQKRTVAALRRRADPLLAADLPPWRPGPPPDGPTVVDLDGPPGTTPLTDAVVLADGSSLVTLGELGVRWYTDQGQVRARWSTPAHGIVAADHGRAALVIRGVGEQLEIHRLDLVDRRLRYWATLRLRGVAGSFDGSTLVTVDGDGISVLDTLGDRPRVVWTELSREQPVLALSRTPTRLTALTFAEAAVGTRTAPDAGAARPLELFGWDLPAMTLRIRRQIPQLSELTGAAVTGWTAVQRGRAQFGALGISQVREWTTPRFEPLDPVNRVAGVADVLVTAWPDAHGGFLARLALDDGTTATVRGPGAVDEIGVERHAGIVTVMDRAGGRLVGFDAQRGDVLTRLRTGI